MGQKNKSGLTATNNESDREIIDRTLYFIAQRGWKESEGDFLTALCLYLTSTLNVRYALIGRAIGTPPTDVETIALVRGNDVLPPITYSLAGTPCESVSNQNICCYPTNIQEHFPNDRMLADMGAASYIGVPLWNSQGEILGLISLINSEPLGNTTLLNTVLQIVAVRAAAELEHRLAEKQLTEQQQQIQATFDNAGVGIAYIETNGDLKLANQKLCDMLEYSTGDLQVMSVRDITFPADWDKSREAMERALSSPPGLHSYTLEKRYVAASNRIIWCLVTVTLVRDSHGNPDYFVTVAEDITRRKSYQEQLRQARDEAERANRAKSTFLANMSHELRTPLNAILGFAEMMDEEIHGKIPEKYRDYASHIRKSGQHLLHLINEILDLSRIETGKLELDISDCNLPAVAHEVLEELAIKAQIESVTLKLQINPQDFPIVQLDHLRIRQTLTNLVHNAIKFSPGGTVTIQLEATHSALKISVTDTGIGMSKEDIAVALSLFGQVETDYLSKKSEGTGLGLPLAKQFVELQGGKLTVASKQGEGTTITAYFPNAVGGQ
ncbi:GAF domain-containing sensor histidine kinase [Aestuariispira ectoiniformans]|uniref:GAF domain-containing sensor histidine kinase n=1 Tax=Aestuariispira ectoiniformans TaxID=2775080 RepID=UPI00223BAD8B|nr:ATP-binding protein [Aestuariispira ectoiniformans]